MDGIEGINDLLPAVCAVAKKECRSSVILLVFDLL